ncbi:beta-1,3-galactosyltransferase 5-like [Homarus americanus]|uniref:beta-1,3-galactosyltransferase 5-like n=1 Tax=Homarus americanus TaxID=6706 RepID=UPI001C461466|nr:beta-1,3-galactosyltransferase 5-like [Homarus americanus]XP_042222948.1 beta-1,3-galactosyltransferase 5-like [Homarus americanus]
MLRILTGLSVCMLAFIVIICILLQSKPRLRPIQLSYKFIKVREDINLTGPTINPIPDEVNWLEDLMEEVDPVCNGSNPFVLAIVPSAVHHFKEREGIRNTWAHPGLYPYTKMRAIFVLGATDNFTLQDEVNLEMDAHHDIIQNDFLDTYRNLTYKTISMLSWVKNWCLDTPFIAKIDDDVVVNPLHLVAYLQTHVTKNKSLSAIHGHLRSNSPALRNGKWAVSKEEFPPSRFPPFMLGPAYIIGRNSIDRLLVYSSYVPFLWLEDVFLTGLVAHAAGVEHIQVEKILYTKKLSRQLYKGKVAFYPGASEKNKKNAWAGIIKYSRITKLLKKKK